MTASPVVPEHDLLVVDSDEQLRRAAAAFLGEGRAGGDLMRASLPGWLVEELAPSLPEVTFAAAEQAVWRRRR